ncbi:MAG: autotransporter domain-containing protein [Candidatus Omnitrophica bacterium]|nr:autotransporter domain-containing protein [Candidatus Omnitrophota bacterium]
MRTSIILIFIIALCCGPLLCSLAFGEAAWTFAVVGDTRGEPDTTTGASEYLPAIATKIASLTPNLVVVSGDLINGDALDNSLDVNNPRIPYATQVANWKAAMKPVYDAAIAIYPLRGNHENYASDHNPTIESLKQAYFDGFGSTVPQNGPNNRPDDNQVGFSWNLSKKNVRIIAADQYFYFQQTPLGGRNYYQIDQSWLEAQLRKTAPRRYTFVVAHEPVFSLDTEEGGFYGTSAEGMADRDTFWNSLGANGVKMYLTAHVHNLQVGTAVDDNGNIIYQNMTGNGGAHLNAVEGVHDPRLTPTFSKDNEYGFSLYTVTDNNITVTYYLYNPDTSTWKIDAYTITLLANPVYTWNTALGTFSTAASWDPATVPGAADTAVFDSGPASTSTVNFTANAHNKRLFVASGPVTFNLAGKTYTADSTAIDGSEDASYRPALTISGAGSTFNTISMTMDGVSSFTVGAGATATCNTITIEGGTPTIEGNINVTTLDLGESTLTVVGAYTQPAGTTLNLTANSSSNFGNITSNAAAAVNAGSAVNVKVGGYIPNNATLTILNTGGLGIGNVPGTITSSNQYVTFLGSSLDGNLVLTGDRTATGFEHVATNSNSAAVGAVLDNITDPSADMTTVLDTLDNLSSSQVASSENTMSPTADGGLIDATNGALDQFVGKTVIRLQDSKVAEDKDKNASSQDTLRRNDVWALAYGDYAHQGERGLSNGYLARLWGDVMGIDRSFMDNSLRLGLAQGFGWGQILSKDSCGRTAITSYQTGLYGEYEGENRPYILDAVLTYGYNDYDSSRSVNVGGTDRTASSDYSGQQFSSYLEGGYKFKNKNFDITPLLAINYTHLHVAGYTETGANALNLSVDAQNYDTLQLGTGFRISCAFETENILFTPELHFRYFYDVINDRQQTLAAFVGGGTSFQTTGFRPAPSNFDLGARFEFFNKKNVTLLADLDTVLKDGFYEAGGSLTLKYSF